MSNCLGRQVRYSLFGESHGTALGIVIDHLPPGFELDLQAVQHQLNRRKPGGTPYSTARQEADEFEIISGFYKGKTTGAPLCAILRNTDQRSSDYEQMKRSFRPSHSDYAAWVKYGGHNDVRGGGHFSGRITAVLVLAGAIAQQCLATKGMAVVGHILKSGEVEDHSFLTYAKSTGDRHLQNVHAVLASNKNLIAPMLKQEGAGALLKRIEEAKVVQDAVGGTVEVALTGMKAGMGNPYFESLESELAKALFSIPGIKGLSFGAGFEFANLYASEANDAFEMCNGQVITTSNNSGGINGGISNGMPIVLQAVFRPTPTLSRSQKTVDSEGESLELRVGGRHDPCIFLRGLPVVEAVMAMVALDVMRHEF